jgi:hypothetical protein
MGDVDDDGVYDLVVGAGAGHAPRSWSFGRAKDGGSRLRPSSPASPPSTRPRPAASIVAVAQIDGTSDDNIVVGSGPGAPSAVKVFSTELPASPGTAPAEFASFSSYPGDSSGVTLSTGFVDFTTGRRSIVTAPGPGTPSKVKVFVFPLFTPIADAGGHDHGGNAGEPVLTTEFAPFGDAYSGGVSLATGWLAGQLGSAERIVVGQLDGGAVKVFSAARRSTAAPDVPAQLGRAPACQLRGGFLPPVRRDRRRQRRHHQHHRWRRPPGQRPLVGRRGGDGAPLRDGAARRVCHLPRRGACRRGLDRRGGAAHARRRCFAASSRRPG